MTFTIHRDALAIVPPTKVRGELKALYEKVDAKHGGYVSVTLEPPKRPRTTGEKSQGNCINGYIQQICKETGNDFDDVKMYCKTQAISRGYPFKANDHGDIVYSVQTGNPLPESESKITVEQASILIDAIVQLAGELNISLKSVD